MNHAFKRLSALLAMLAPAGITLAQTDSAVDLAAVSDASLTSAADELDPLKKSFNNLYYSLRNQGGMSDKDRPTVTLLRERFSSFNETNPEHQQGLMYELQLALWLKDDPRIDHLYEGLMMLNPDEAALGLSWADYFFQKADYSRADRAYDRLVNLYPENTEIRLTHSRQLKERNLYARAITILQRYEFDFGEFPEAAVLLSDALFADHRFEEAISVLESIPDDVSDQKRPFKDAAEASLVDLKQYLEYWQQEQEIRAREEEANDLPRAEIITTRGLIVVELFENEAPNTVANFIALSEEKFYAGTRFHNVLPNLLAQAGDPYSKPGATGILGDGTPGYYIRDEHFAENHRKHFAGSLAMAKSPIPNTAGCQFYFTHTPLPMFNGKNTVFGRILSGLNTARLLQQDDRIEVINIVRKRDHDYIPEKIPLSAGPTRIELNSKTSDFIDPGDKQNKQE